MARIGFVCAVAHSSSDMRKRKNVTKSVVLWGKQHWTRSRFKRIPDVAVATWIQHWSTARFGYSCCLDLPLERCSLWFQSLNKVQVSQTRDTTTLDDHALPTRRQSRSWCSVVVVDLSSSSDQRVAHQHRHCHGADPARHWSDVTRLLRHA